MSIILDGLEVGSVVLTEEGTILILHILACEECHSSGCAYINMARVDGCDKVHETLCPMCHSENLVLITYRILEEMRENTEGEEE